MQTRTAYQGILKLVPIQPKMLVVECQREIQKKWN